MALDSSKRTLVFDSEASGLLDTPNLRFYCVVAQDYDTDEMFLFHDFPQYCNTRFTEDDGTEYVLPKRNGTLKDGVLFLHKADNLICHNALGYDFFLMKKFFPKFEIRYDYPKIRDTLLESQVQWFDRPKLKGYKGNHGLEVWGARVGIVKPQIKDWSYMDAKKLHRCLEDVKINTAVAKELEVERQKLMENCGLDFTEALTTEHEYAYWSTVQELNGAVADVPHMERCIVELDELTEKLRLEIEPQLPPTVKPKSVKETANAVQEALGIPEEMRKPIKLEKRVHNGEEKYYPIKEYYKPSTKWANRKDVKMYAIHHNGVEVRGHEFRKLKEARDWAKENIDKQKGDKVTFPAVKKEVRDYDAHTKNYFGEAELLSGATEITGPFTRVELIPSTMSQHDKVKLLLVSLGWQTDEWTFEKDSKGQFVRAKESGVVVWPEYKVNGFQLVEHYKAGDRIPRTPKLNDDSYDTLPDGVGQTIGEYNTYSHRRKFIQNPNDGSKGLLNNIREDGRIACGIMSFGTSAGRAAQYGWVNAPSVQALYGENIRKIIIAPEGHKLVGVDMPSAHPRILADPYCTGNDKFIAAVDGKEFDESTGEYIGEDFHTVNAELFGLITGEQILEARRTQLHDAIAIVSKGRKTGKGGSYCTLYGGSDKKLAITIKIPEQEGAKIKQQFLSGLGLDLLLEEVEATWDAQSRAKGSYISVLGGYHIWSNSKHKIINYKALGSEAVIQKHAVIWICREIAKRGLDVKLICNVHDELLFEVPDEQVEEFAPLATMVYDKAAKGLGLVLDWTSQAQVGMSYDECH